MCLYFKNFDIVLYWNKYSCHSIRPQRKNYYNLKKCLTHKKRATKVALFKIDLE